MNETILDLTTRIVSAHIGYNTVRADQLPTLIPNVHRTLATLGKAGAEAPWCIGGVNRSRGGISIHKRNRTCHCRHRNEPAAGDRRHVATIASAAIYSFGGLPENWRSLR
jgi:hypothetical protein